jgi:hypothetical protein
MSWGVGLLIIFGGFVLLLVLNPNLSCFGKRVSSPLYPLLRKKKQKQIQTDDYGFILSEDGKKRKPSLPPKILEQTERKKVKTYDYGFSLSEGGKKSEAGEKSDSNPEKTDS